MTEDSFTDIDRTDETTKATAATQAAVSSDYKVRGKQNAPGGTGVLGHNTAASGSSYGVEGVSEADGNADTGSFPAGVRGATSGSGIVRGVFGEADTQSGRGVVGTVNKNSSVQHDVNTGYPAGVWGATDQSTADSGIGNAFGVVGQAVATSGTAFGVAGTNRSPKGYGVAGEDVSGSDSAYGVISFGNSKTEGNHEVTGTQSVGNVGVEAFLGSDQTIPSGSSTRIAFDSTEADDTGSFDSTNNEYTLPYDGDYQIDVGIRWVTTFASGDSLFVNTRSTKEGTIIRNAGSGPGTPHSSSSKVVKGLSKGDSIYVEVLQNSGSDATVLGVNRSYTWLSVNKIA